MRTACGVLFAILVSAGFTACGGSAALKRYDRQQAPVVVLPSGEQAQVKLDADGVLTAGLTPSATETQLVRASENSPIAGTELAFPPGALAVAVDVTIRPGSVAVSGDLEQELGIAASNPVVGGGVPVQIDASQVVTLGQPFVVALQVPDGAGLVARSLDNLAVLYQVKNEAEGRLESGLVPRGELTIENGRVLHSSLHFGWFRVVYLSRPATVRAVNLDSKVKAVRGLLLVQTTDGVPSCGATDVGLTVYVKAENTFRTCTAAGWEAISLTGPQGPAGAQGPAGPQGSGGFFKLVDGNNAKVGDIVGFTSGSVYSGGSSTVLALADNSIFGAGFDGTWISVCATGNCENPYYDFMLSRTITPGCFHVGNACAGPCYIKNPIPGGLYRGGTTYHKYTNAPVLAVTLASVWDLTTPASPVCRPNPAVPPTAHATTAYAFPAGVVTPPYTLPLSVGRN